MPTRKLRPNGFKSTPTSLSGLMTDGHRKPYSRNLNGPHTNALKEMLSIAFKGNYINEPDHPIIKRLKGRL